MEMVLVLALIVVLAALTYPPINEMYAHYRVTAAADQVRARWADARAQAVNEGRPYRFAVIRNKGNFRLAPDGPEFWSGNGSSPEGALVVEDALPRGIRFALGEAGEDLTSDTVLPVDGISPDMWTGVVTFLPDGSATALDGSDANEVRITFQARHAAPLQLRLRTLTGTVTVQSLPEVNR
jgi:Tfp pilus assembly protein FimT